MTREENATKKQLALVIKQVALDLYLAAQRIENSKNLEQAQKYLKNSPEVLQLLRESNQQVTDSYFQNALNLANEAQILWEKNYYTFSASEGFTDG